MLVGMYFRTLFHLSEFAENCKSLIFLHDIVLVHASARQTYNETSFRIMLTEK